MNVLKNGLLCFFIIGFIFSCNNDDDVNIEVLVQTEDAMFTIFDNPELGDEIGEVFGSTTRGIVSYSIASQTPANAFNINNISGEITVSMPSLFDATSTPVMTLAVLVRNGDVSATSNITVNVLAGVVDNDGDGVTSDIDIDDNDPCLPEQFPGYLSYNQSNPIWAAADCDGDGLSNGTEVINGSDPYNFINVPCDSTADTVAFNTNLQITNQTPFGTDSYTLFQDTGRIIVGCGTVTIINLFNFTNTCVDGSDALESYVITLTPSLPNATSGTTSIENYDCQGNLAPEFTGTGTYDEVAGIISVNFSISGGPFPFAGVITLEII